MEEFENDGQPMIRLNQEEADYFIARARLTAAQLRLSSNAYKWAICMVACIFFLCLFQLLGGNTGMLVPVGICLFWVGFFSYRAWDRMRDARKMEKVADRLLQEIGKEEIRRALEGEP